MVWSPGHQIQVQDTKIQVQDIKYKSGTQNTSPGPWITSPKTWVLLFVTLKPALQHPRPDFRTYTRPRTPTTCPGHQIHIQNINLYTKILPKSTKIPKITQKTPLPTSKKRVKAEYRCGSNDDNNILQRPVNTKTTNPKIDENRKKHQKHKNENSTTQKNYSPWFGKVEKIYIIIITFIGLTQTC